MTAFNTPEPSSSRPISCATYWRLTAISIVAVAALALTGCAGMTQREQGTLVGTTAGAVAGGVLTGSTTGAAVGAAAGGVIGNEVSKKKR